MFYEEIRRQAEAAPRAALPSVAAALWKAFGDGQVSEAEAEALSALIEARRIVPEAAVKVRVRVGSRPRTGASMERRRRWAASGRLPPALAARFTLAEQAVLALVASESARRGDCRLAVGHVAAIVGVAETTVRNAIREARKLGLVTVEERRISGFRNDTNIVRIVSAEWQAWLRLARRGGAARDHRSESGSSSSSVEGGGCRSAQRTPTVLPYPVNPAPWKPKKGCRQAAGDPTGKASPRIRAAGRAGRAMP